MEKTIELLEDCKELSETYASKITDYTRRTNWTASNDDVTDLDLETLEYIEDDIRKTREEIKNKLLILERHLPRD
jgi:dsDNA-specific endonuclease/ATPase MutS2